MTLMFMQSPPALLERGDDDVVDSAAAEAAGFAVCVAAVYSAAVAGIRPVRALGQNCPVICVGFARADQLVFVVKFHGVLLS